MELSLILLLVGISMVSIHCSIDRVWLRYCFLSIAFLTIFYAVDMKVKDKVQEAESVLLNKFSLMLDEVVMCNDEERDQKNVICEKDGIQLIKEDGWPVKIIYPKK